MSVVSVSSSPGFILFVAEKLYKTPTLRQAWVLLSVHRVKVFSDKVIQKLSVGGESKGMYCFSDVSISQ